MTLSESILKYLKSNPNSLAQHVSKALDVDVKAVSGALKALCLTGAVVGEGNTRGRKYRVA